MAGLGIALMSTVMGTAELKGGPPGASAASTISSDR
jgi:hypothetical protein